MAVTAGALRGTLAAALRGGIVALLALGFATAAHAAQITLKSAWMRPATQGTSFARVYVDIDSDTALDLVGAKSPFARKIAIVRVPTIGDASTEKVVAKYPIEAGKQARLAYLGDHLRFVGITADAVNGVPVPLTLVFRDRAGKKVEASTTVKVRGLVALPPDPAPDANPAGKSPAK